MVYINSALNDSIVCVCYMTLWYDSRTVSIKNWLKSIIESAAVTLIRQFGYAIRNILAFKDRKNNKVLKKWIEAQLIMK